MATYASARVIEHNNINDDLYAVVDKNVVNKKRELRDNNVEPTSMSNENRYGYTEDRSCPSIPKSFSSEHNLELSRLTDDPGTTKREVETYRRKFLSTEDMLDSSKIPQAQTESHLDHSNRIPLIDRHSSSSCITESLSDAELKQLREFKKQHRRIRSHESFDKIFVSSNKKYNNNGSINNNSSHLLNNGEYDAYSLSNSTLEKSDEHLDGLLSPPLEESDVFHDTSHEKVELFMKSKEMESGELPEGWEECVEGAETYYWHLWTGTIQYERPTCNATQSSSSRSISPFSGNDSATSSRTSSLSDPYEEKTCKSSSVAVGSEVLEKSKVVSFPVHSMGWMNVDEELMSSSCIGETVNKCIATLAEKRLDLWSASETWANGEDLKLVLEGETLKLIETKTKSVIHVQPIAKMRVWGVGRIENRDFAYIARDQTTGKHKCHMFRCHGHLSARSITTALHTICNRVLEEKRKAKERCESPMYRTGPSDLMKPPPKSGSAFNEKPYADQKKCFTAKYVGSIEVPRSAGIDVINKTVNKLSEGKDTTDWPSVLLEVTTSEIRTIDCTKQELILEHRVRFISFLGVAHDERFGAYIVATGKDCFMCNVLFCAPHAGILTKAIEEACKLRFEKMLDGKVPNKPFLLSDEVVPPEPEYVSAADPECIVAQPVFNPTAEIGHSPTPVPPPPPRGVRERTKGFTSSIVGVFSKLNKKDTKKKDDELMQSNACIPGPNEHLVKYFGSVSVDIGTGVETVQKAVDNLAGGEMMIGYIEILSDCVSLSDSQRTALSKRFFDFNNISYCGMTSDRRHFGIIISRGKGKYICHVFEEYKVNCGEIVSAIHEVL